jgi:hypothetical protein
VGVSSKICSVHRTSLDRCASGSSFDLRVAVHHVQLSEAGPAYLHRNPFRHRRRRARACSARDAFSGTIIDLIRHPETGSEDVKFAIQDVFKGLDATEVTVECPIVDDTGFGSDCSYPFQIAKSYLVYASRKQGIFETSRCFRNSRLKQAGTEVKILKRLTRSDEIAALLKINSIPMKWDPGKRSPRRLASVKSGRS